MKNKTPPTRIKFEKFYAPSSLLNTKIPEEIAEGMARIFESNRTMPFADIVPQENTQSLTVELLHDLMKKLPPDPLLERGIPKDWVCVVGYAMLSQLYEEFPECPYSPGKIWTDPQWITGRRTYIEHRAPAWSVEYMSPVEYENRYPSPAVQE